MSNRNPDEKQKQDQWKKPGDENVKDPRREQKPGQPQRPQQPVGTQPGQKPQHGQGGQKHTE
jgi:hypothetical protein